MDVNTAFIYIMQAGYRVYNLRRSRIPINLLPLGVLNHEL